MNEITKTESTEYIPRQTLRVFVQALLSAKVKGNKEEAERVTGIDKQLFYWHLKKHSEFRDWYNSQCDKALLAIRRTIDLDLVKESGKGNTAAMKLYYELIGRLKDQRDAPGVNVNVNVYPQKTIVFQDAKTDGDEQLTDRNTLHADQSAEGDFSRQTL